MREKKATMASLSEQLQASLDSDREVYAQKRLEEEKFAAQRWHVKATHYMLYTSWGVGLLLFVVVLLLLCLIRPRFVCRRAPSPYQRDPLDFVKALSISFVTVGVYFIICYAFNCL